MSTKKPQISKKPRPTPPERRSFNIEQLFPDGCWTSVCTSEGHDEKDAIGNADTAGSLNPHFQTRATPV